MKKRYMYPWQERQAEYFRNKKIEQAKEIIGCAAVCLLGSALFYFLLLIAAIQDG